MVYKKSINSCHSFLGPIICLVQQKHRIIIMRIQSKVPKKIIKAEKDGDGKKVIMLRLF